MKQVSACRKLALSVFVWSVRSPCEAQQSSSPLFALPCSPSPLDETDGGR